MIFAAGWRRRLTPRRRSRDCVHRLLRLGCQRRAVFRAGPDAAAAAHSGACPRQGARCVAGGQQPGAAVARSGGPCLLLGHPGQPRGMRRWAGPRWGSDAGCPPPNRGDGASAGDAVRRPLTSVADGTLRSESTPEIQFLTVRASVRVPAGRHPIGAEWRYSAGCA